MKIIFITPSFYPATYYGGPIYSTYELAKSLKKQQVEISLLTTNANGKEKLKVETGVFQELESGLMVKYYNSLDSRSTSPTMFLNIWRDIKETEIVYLISIFSPPSPLTIIICSLLNKKLIISPRGQLGKWCLNQGNRLKKLWLKVFISPFIKKLVWHLTSEQEQRDIKAVYPRANTFVVPNGIDIKRTENGEQKKDKLFYHKYLKSVNEYSRVVISMGRLQKVKGFEILINAFGILIKHFPDSVLLIAGEDFGERSTLLDLVSASGLKSNINLIGHLEGEEKINFLKNADVFALASHHENFGMVYGEALAAGTPIIASTNTPWQDVEKYNCGKWVENTPGKFAEAMINLLNSNPIQMGANGRKFVEENFSWDKIALNFKEQIKKLMLSEN